MDDVRRAPSAARLPTMTKGGRRVTINDVARLSGVSKASVSQAMNGAGRLRPETVRRVQEAAELLGWRPSAAARAVSGGPANAVGLVILRRPEVLDTDPFFSIFLAGVESRAVDHDYSVVIRFVADEQSESLAYRDMVAARRVDGFMVFDLRDHDPRPDLLTHLDASAVVIGDLGSDNGFPCVYNESASTIDELVGRMVDLGHRRLAHITGSPELVHSRRRAAHFADAAERRGLDFPLEVPADFTASGGQLAMRRLLRRAQRPTAVFCSSDLMAIGAMAEAYEQGVRVPEDVSIAGFDGIEMVEHLRPTLATISCQYRQLGATAFDLVLKVIAGESVPPLVVQESTYRPGGTLAAPAG